MTRTWIVVGLLVFASLFGSVLACPFCLAPMQTWSEMVAESEVVCLAKLISVTEGSKSEDAHSVLEVSAFHKGSKLLLNTTVRIEEYLYGKPGDLFLLKGSMKEATGINLVETFATDSDGEALTVQPAIQKVSATVESKDSVALKSLEWDFIERVTQESYKYITEAPSLDSSAIERLTYFMPFLEHSEPLIAADAWGEFANSAYKDIAAVRSLLPREKLRTWIQQPDTSPERLGSYGMMLGLCGNDSDAAFLKQQIGQPNADEIRFGVEGLMGGLLLLTGEEGLKFLEETRLQRSGISDLESLAAVHALQFVWTYEPEMFPKDRLRNALHPMIQNAALRELVIKDLARWNDWTLVPQLASIYETSRDEDPGAVRAIVGYLVTCKKSDAANETQIAAATELLEEIRQQDPRVVRIVESSLR